MAPIVNLRFFLVTSLLIWLATRENRKFPIAAKWTQRCHAPLSCGRHGPQQREMSQQRCSEALWSGVGWSVRHPAATPTTPRPRCVSTGLGGSYGGVWGHLKAEIERNEPQCHGSPGSCCGVLVACYRPSTPPRGAPVGGPYVSQGPSGSLGRAGAGRVGLAHRALCGLGP